MTLSSTSSHGTPTATAALDLDPLAPAMIVDPYPTYARLRAAGPVYLDPPGTWFLARHADVQQVLRDPRFGRAGFGAVLDAVFGPGPVQRSFSRFMLFIDPPDHTRLRALVTKAFTPRTVERLRPGIQRTVDCLLDAVVDRGEFDLIADLAYPLPVMVISELLGVPSDDRDRFHDWSAAIAKALDVLTVPRPDIVARSNEAVFGLTEYFRGLVAARRKRPREDLLSALVAAEDEGHRLCEEELLATCVLLFFAGHETTVNLIGNGMLALLRHPDQLARLRADRSLIGSAVEELLRYDGPVQRTGRVVLADVEIGGRAIRRGERVSALPGAANRDPARFADPDRLDVARADTHHLAFGGGIHYCLGAALARVEAQIAIDTLIHRLPNLSLRTDAPAWRENLVLRGLTALPLST
jgi:pimeloyl-[acyl-carrier protein] synthase